MTEFDWGALMVVQDAQREAIPEMVTHALAVLQDLLEDTNHVCTFTFQLGKLGDDLAASVNELLPSGFQVSALRPVAAWREVVREELPGRFFPHRLTRDSTWAEGSAARSLAEALVSWVVALLGRLWPERAPSWVIEVSGDDWYEAVYVDLVVQAGDEVSVLHLGLSD